MEKGQVKISGEVYRRALKNHGQLTEEDVRKLFPDFASYKWYRVEADTTYGGFVVSYMREEKK